MVKLIQLRRVIILIAIFIFVQCNANPDELKFVENYWDGLKLAQEKDKPIFLHFTCHGCAPHELMDHFATSKKIQQKLNNEFITVFLYVDERKRLDKLDFEKIENSTLSEEDKKEFLALKTTSRVNSLLERKIFKNTSQPLYVVIDSDEQILIEPFGYIKKDRRLFLKKLNEGLKKWNESHK